MNTFNCNNPKCGKVATVKNFYQHDGEYYADCNHCGARHKTEQLLTLPGAPLEFRVVGLAAPK